MVDRVYKRSVPTLREELESLRKEFAALDTPTDWARLRVAPVLAHARALERLLRSPRFAGEFDRLNRGVVLFHSDLSYLRTNVQGLRHLLESERARRRS